MQLAIVQAAEIGYFDLPFHGESPLFLVFWLSLLAGAGIQLILFRKARRRRSRWWFLALLVVGLVACEVGCQLIQGWDLLVPLFLYCFFFTLLLGAGLGLAIHFIKRQFQEVSNEKH